MEQVFWDGVAWIKSFDWVGAAKIVIGAGAGSAAATSFREHRAKKAKATYAALRAAIALESYAISCWRITLSEKRHFEQFGSPFAEAVPELAGMPTDADWKDVDPILVNETLSFANTLSIAQISAEYARVFEGNPFEAETSSKERGRVAWAISKKLRTRYRLASREDDEKSLKELLN